MVWTPTGEVVLSKEGVRLVQAGQLNIYSKWMVRTKGPVVAGDVVVIVDEDGEQLGIGFYEDIGAIAVRVLDRVVGNPKEIITLRISRALELRNRLPLGNFFRWVHSEADGLPGLIVDVYDDVAVLTSTSLGFDRRLEEVAQILSELYPLNSIIVRNDTRTRKEVGLPLEVRVLQGRAKRPVIREGSALFEVDPVQGQKTGFFIDQRPNRLEVEDLVGPGDRVLDLFSYTGGFAVHAAISGAEVKAVDESEQAIRDLRRNARLNSVDIAAFQMRVKEFMESDTGQYDLVIVDPPALAPSRDMVSRAKRTYTAVNAAAMERVVEGGFMFTSSCSHFISEGDLLKILERSAALAGREFRILGKRGPSPDHPWDLIHPWTLYLKGFLLEII